LILLSELDHENYVCILLLRLGISGASPHLLLNQSFSFDTKHFHAQGASVYLQQSRTPLF